MPTFAEIQDEIVTMLDSAEELTPEQHEVMDAYLTELAGQEAEKVDNFCFFIKENEARAEFLKEESSRIAKKAKSIEAKIAFLKNLYLGNMMKYGLTKVTGGVYSIGTRRAQSVSVTALVDTLPAEFVRIKETKEADKKAIKSALDSGVKIDGCELSTSYSLQIK